MDKWEYMRYSPRMRDDLVEKLNEFGQQGWELVCMDAINGYYMLKRKIAQ